MLLLSLPTFVSIIITALASDLFSVALYYAVHPFWAKELTEDTKKTADVVAMRVGVVYAVVIGMMFANVRIEHFQMIEAVESEASALIRLHDAIERQSGENSLEVRTEIKEYVRFIVDEQWPALREARMLPGDREMSGRERLNRIWDYVIEVEQKTDRKDLSRLLDQIEHSVILRLFDAKGNLLPLFWYISLFGYVASLLTLYVSPPTFRRCILVSLYSSMVAVVMMGIYVLSHPYSTAAGIEPDVFKLLLNASVQ